jgi:predicted membrane-bound spermidine synthase
MDSTSAPAVGVRMPFPLLYAVFFTSGCAALLYQLVWQRELFNVYGSNVETVTVVVTVFMLGLGVGSLAGGELSKRLGARLLIAFGLVEVGIGLFGLLSLRLFAFIGSFTSGWSLAGAGLACFLMLLVPTTLMGATLPLLVAHWVRGSGNVGRSVGALYFVNTLGSAFSSLAAALILFRALGMSGTVGLAAALNLILGSTLLVVSLRERGR